ncbi:MAG: hypothetical protein H7122_02615 [Chitinophagaceae bacterium]|nr:hypothetical protein [Chitinophagaceae bacterium]
MLQQLESNSLPVETGQAEHNTSLTDAPCTNGGKKAIQSLFDKFNPASWFNEISNIKITMEEEGD